MNDLSSNEEAEPDPETGRELVVVDPDERSESWVYRFLTRLGLRTRGTLRDDLNEALAGDGEAGDLFSPEERAMLQNILRLRERRVENIMVQRAEIEAVDEKISLSDLLRQFEETGHSRMPVYNENLDDPRGMVLVKDLLLYVVGTSSQLADKQSEEGEQQALDLGKIDLSTPLKDLGVTRSIQFVPPSMLAADLMGRMQTTRTQMALVIDEYGGTDGLVTLEDIVEEVVGEIEDEHDDDEDEAAIVDESDGRWIADARAELDKVKEKIGKDFDPGEEGEDVETIGGLVASLAGHVPVRGEVVRGMSGFEFRILDADPRRIRRVEIVQKGARPGRRRVHRLE